MEVRTVSLQVMWSAADFGLYVKQKYWMKLLTLNEDNYVYPFLLVFVILSHSVTDVYLVSCHGA